jgi:hypothetical protein
MFIFSGREWCPLRLMKLHGPVIGDYKVPYAVGEGPAQRRGQELFAGIATAGEEHAGRHNSLWE